MVHLHEPRNDHEVMAFEINTFRSVVRGFQKLEHYRVRFPYPSLMLSDTYQTGTKNTVPFLEFLSDTVILPGVAMGTRPINRYGYGPSEKKPVFPQFSEVMMTFYADQEADILTFFQAWMNSIFNFNMQGGISNLATQNTPSIPYVAAGGQDAYEVSYKDDYAVDAWLTLLDNSENVIHTTYLRQCYPIHIADTQLGWGLTNDVMRVSVYFAFNDWYIVTGDPDSPVQTTAPLTSPQEPAQPILTSRG